jgi:hypothetical protein
MYVMPNSTASDAAPESAQYDFPHSLLHICICINMVPLALVRKQAHLPDNFAREAMPVIVAEFGMPSGL